MKWSYFNKGNLNILFINEDGTKLLRLSQKTSHNTSLENYNNLSNFHRFANYIPTTTLIRASEKLICMDDRIKGDDTHALIIDNVLVGMTSKTKVSRYISLHTDDTNNKIIVEFKPKWLYHCDTLNCRNCCLNVLKNHETVCCPLNLLDLDQIYLWCKEVFQHTSFKWAITKLENVFKKDDILKILYEEQTCDEFHSELLSLGKQEDVTLQLRKQMTLRDVTLFVSIYKDNTSYEIKMCDIDLKPSAKFKHWKRTELELQKLYNKDLDLNCNKNVNL